MFGFSKSVTTKEDFLHNTETTFLDDKKVLLLSCLWVEATNYAFSSHALKHDLIELSHEPLPEGMKRDIESQVEGDSIIEDVKDTLSRRQDDISEALVSRFYTYTPEEWETYQNQELTKKRHLDKVAHLRAFKKRFESVHTRTWLITYQMWCVRMAVCLGKVEKEKGWELLREQARFLETVLPSFENWQGFFHNIQMAENLFNCEYTGFEKSIEGAAKILIKDPNSPVQGIPLFDKESVPDNFVAYTNKVPPRIHYRDTPPYASFMKMLKNPDKSLLWDFFRGLAASNSKEHEQKAHMCVQIVEPKTVDYEDAILWPAQYPDEPMAWVLRGRWYMFWAYEARGGGTADTITEDGRDLFHHRMDLSIQDYLKAYELDRDNPLIISEMLLTVPLYAGRDNDLYEELEERTIREFSTHTPSLVYMGFHKTRKWGGDENEHLEFARWAIKQGQEKESDATLAPMLLFEAAIEQWLYEDRFDKDIEDEITPILRDKDLHNEINRFFPKILEKMEINPMWIGSWMAFWYFLVNDIERLRQIIQRMNELAPGCYYNRPFTYMFQEKTVERIFYWLRWL